MSTTIAAPSTGAALFSDDEIRVDGRDKVSGRMRYTADITRPNLLWAAFAISPHAHARVVRVDASAAREVPGVKAVLTAADIGNAHFGRMLDDWPVLAYDTVRFIGDRVAAVAAETPSAAEAAVRLIEVTYEVLPAVLTQEDALRADAPVLHPERDRYAYRAYAGKPHPSRAHPNLQGSNLIEKGDADLDARFAAAHRVFKHTFRTPRQHCGYLEPHATLVWIDDDGTVHVQSPNKSPFNLREQMARTCGLDKAKLVIETSAIGGDFGGKGLTVDEFPCYFLAKATGRPVKHVMTYTDELQASTVRHPATIVLETAVDASGKFVAHRSRVDYNGGAYAAGKPGPRLLPGQLGYSTVGYGIPHVRLEVRNVYTNTIPGAHMRAPSDVQIFFAWEQHVDIIARELRIDALELRKLNVMRDGETALTGEPMSHVMGLAVLEALERHFDLQAALPPGRGRGMAFVCRHTGGGKTQLRATLTPDGRIAVVTGVPDQGSGSFTVIARVIAATMGIDAARISVRRGNTDESLLDPGSGASRVTHIVGGAAKDAAEKLRALLEERSGLELRDDVFVDASGAVSANFEEVAQTVTGGTPLDVVGSFDGSHEGPEHPADYSFSAFGFDVTVDVETGALRINDALLVTDVGTIINPVTHQGQIDGGFVYGIGGALMEEMPVDDSGKIETLSLGEYKLPTIADVPPFRTVLVKSPGGNGPYGAKMAGELSNSGVAPAIVNAIVAAAGVRLTVFPITSERVFDALQERAGQTA